MVNVEINVKNTTKFANFKEFWDSLSKSERGEARRSLLVLLRIPESAFYQKLNSDSFLPHERAIISAFFGVSQQDLFPNTPVIFPFVNIQYLK